MNSAKMPSARHSSDRRACGPSRKRRSSGGACPHASPPSGSAAHGPRIMRGAALHRQCQAGAPRSGGVTGRAPAARRPGQAASVAATPQRATRTRATLQARRSGTIAAPGRGMTAERIVLLGAAGRDLHNFNVVHRDDPSTVVVAFTATQIPGIAHRRYPPSLAGPRYPTGIPIEDESALEAICRRERVTRVEFAYSDVTHEHVMTLAGRALALGAGLAPLGPDRAVPRAAPPRLAVSPRSPRRGKSPIARWLARRLHAAGRRVAVVRHPMPYSDLERQRVQRFAAPADLDAARCTIEEREEYEPHLAAGHLVFAGVDYAEILARVAAEADVLVWDGGNNDFPFIRPDLHVVVADALRPDDASGYHPGESVLRMADAVVVNKVNAAPASGVARAIEAVRRLNATAPVVRGALPVRLDAGEPVRGRRVLVVEDGPTLTHGSMPYGAGYVAATAAGVAAVVDPRPAAAPA